jgi:hypothetical protein
MKRWIGRLKEELLVLFGYSIGIFLLSGFFLDAEYYPRDNVFWTFKTLIETAIPDIYLRTTLALLLLLLFGLSVRKAYAIGGPAGIIAIAMGFLAGLATPTDFVIGPAMLLLAAISAYISVQGWKTLKGPQG